MVLDIDTDIPKRILTMQEQYKLMLLNPDSIFNRRPLGVVGIDDYVTVENKIKHIVIIEEVR